MLFGFYQSLFLLMLARICHFSNVPITGSEPFEDAALVTLSLRRALPAVVGFDAEPTTGAVCAAAASSSYLTIFP